MLARIFGRTINTGPATSLLAELVPFLGIISLLVTILIAWRHEAGVLRTELRPEVERGVVSQRDYDTIFSRRSQLARMQQAYRADGWRGVMALRRLYAAEGELAFVKRRIVVRSRRRPSEATADALRTQIQALREQLGAAA